MAMRSVTVNKERGVTIPFNKLGITEPKKIWVFKDVNEASLLVAFNEETYDKALKMGENPIEYSSATLTLTEEQIKHLKIELPSEILAVKYTDNDCIGLFSNDTLNQILKEFRKDVKEDPNNPIYKLGL